MKKRIENKNKSKTEKGFVRRNSIEIASIVIALCALFLTIYQGIQTRYHNRLSVLPYLQIVHSSTSSKQDYYSIYIENKGMGPARITGIEANVGNEFIRFNEEINYSSIFNSLKKKGIVDVDMSNINFTSFGPNAYIDEGEKVYLMQLQSNSSKESKENFIKAINSIDFLFCYSSVYGDQFYISRAPGLSNENSCRFDDSHSIFGFRFRFDKNFPPIDTKTTHGY